MKRTLLYMICVLFAASTNSCGKDDHNTETGLVVAPSILQQDAVNDITIWAFDAQGVLRQQYGYSSAKEEATALIQIPEGKYTLVGATNLKENFTHNAVVGTMRLEELLLVIGNASSSPAHAHYGIAAADVKASGVSYASLTLGRSMTELSVEIVNVPSEVVSAKLEVLNSSKGFYPATSKLHPETTTVDFGQVAVVERKVVFPLKRLMPTVGATARVDGELKTQLRMTLNYSDGNLLTFELETPILQNGGTYTPKIEYNILRPGIVIRVTTINGWIELPPIHGEILNSDNK